MKRWQIIALATLVVVAIAVAAGYRLGVQLLRNRVVAALGPGARLAELKVNWFSVELRDIAIDAPSGWPAARTFEAEKVTVFPDLRTVFSDTLRISSIVVEKPYLSMLRNPGKLALLPGLANRTRDSSESSKGRAVTISRIELRDGSLDLYDATVSRPPLKTRMEEIEAVIRDVAVPAAEKTQFEIAGIVRGVKRDGRAQVTGWVGPGARDSSSRVILKALDLVALQPYLVKKNDTRVSRGALDLTLNSEVRNNYLDGKGRASCFRIWSSRRRAVFSTPSWVCRAMRSSAFSKTTTTPSTSTLLSRATPATRASRSTRVCPPASPRQWPASSG